MTDFAWFVLVALTAVALASMSIRGVTRYRGWPLAAYLCALALGAALGGAIAVSAEPSYLALGIAIGIGAVELGPAIGAGVRQMIRERAGRQ